MATCEGRKRLLRIKRKPDATAASHFCGSHWAGIVASPVLAPLQACLPADVEMRPSKRAATQQLVYQLASLDMAVEQAEPKSQPQRQCFRLATSWAGGEPTEQDLSQLEQHLQGDTGRWTGNCLPKHDLDS